MRQKRWKFQRFGKALDVFKCLVDEVFLLGGSDTHIERILTDSLLRRQIAQLLVDSQQVRSVGAAKKAESALELPKATETAIRHLDRTISLVMNLSRTLDELIDEGKYYSDLRVGVPTHPVMCMLSNIKKNFDIPAGVGTRSVTIHLLRFNAMNSSKRMHTDEVLREMDAQGLRPATLQELLWIGIQHPDLQREFPVVELGTTRSERGDSSRSVVYLDRIEIGRVFWVKYLSTCQWYEFYRFAAVCK